MLVVHTLQYSFKTYMNIHSFKHVQYRYNGFTIVELLVVIVAIGILATIGIVAYNGVTAQAIETSMKSDLQSSSSQLAQTFKNQSTYPQTTALNASIELTQSQGNTLYYSKEAYGYCLSVSNPRSSNTYRIKNSRLIPEEGTCELTVSTLAGNGSAGFADGQGTAAQFRFPAGLAIDSSDTLYVADRTNHSIRKVTPSGAVTTWAGTFATGFVDGQGNDARFYTPFDVAVAKDNTVYVVDSWNNAIRKISPSGYVTTLAGSGTAGYADGTGAAAQFNGPNGIVVDDTTGNVYVADFNNRRIRKITPSGEVTTFAGSGTAGSVDGPATTAQFRGPTGIDIDETGALYVADVSNNQIRKITASGYVSTVAGASSLGAYVDGDALSARFNAPYDVVIGDEGVLYVADRNNFRIRAIARNGEVSTVAGAGTNGGANGSRTTAQFSHPISLALDSSKILYISDFEGHRIRKIQL
jgi:serine/threonine protein kinase, bacterial